MTYSAVGLLAVVIHLVVNYDVFHKGVGSTFHAVSYYRQFLLSVILFHIFDSLWGFFYSRHLFLQLYISTTIYFIAIAGTILFWSIFVVHYLEDKKLFCTVISYIGRLFFITQISTVGANLFVPILFFIDETGGVQPRIIQFVLSSLQILIFILTTTYSLIISIKAEGSVRRRHLTISLFSIAMILAITTQMFFPTMPFYSLGYLVGCCVLHTFVVDDERMENLRALKESFGREAMQIEELGVTRTLAYTDPLTGVKSKRAYLDIRKQMEQKIADETVKEFAIAVFDVNGLKEVNDNFGHEVGDQHIIGASNLICTILKHSPVFRIGGDEFVAILEGADFEERRSLISDFNAKIEENARTGKVVVSVGLSTYKHNGGSTFASVFKQADENMYKRKAILKELK